MKKLMLLVAVVAVAFGAFADTETIGDYTWTYRINGDVAEIYNSESESAAVSPEPTGAVTIPSTLGGKPVTRIGEYVFRRCSGLTGVTIPDSVTSIGNTAFSGCSGLVSILVGSGNANYKAHNGFLLSKDGKTLIQGVNGDVTIPDGVTSIGSLAFGSYSGLTSVTIPDGVTSIGFGAFSGCSGLTSMTIPNSVTNIVNRAFSGCSGLTSMTIPNSVTSIGEYAFSGCRKLKSIVFEKQDGPISIAAKSFPMGVSVEMIADEGYEFAGWVDSDGSIVDVYTLTNTVSVWPICRLELKVENVTSRQRYPWNGLVDITFNVTGIEGETNGLKFAVAAVMPDSGIVRNISHFWVVQGGTNSVDREIRTNGNYRLLWDARADLGVVRYTNMVVRVNFDEHEKVQLWEGGPYWATTNIGAEKPGDYGYYFWWGDTVGYKREGNAWVATDGSLSNFSFVTNNTPTYGKSFAALQSERWIMADRVLAPEHDAAQVHWGGDWRMPTIQELSNLTNKCDWTWTTQNGVKGYAVKGKGVYASNSIFLPCAGYGDGTSLRNAGAYGYYWSSVPVSSGNGWTYDLLFYSGYLHAYRLRYRNYGQSVRPVQGFTE